MGSKIGPGDTKIFRILASGTVETPPNGGSAFCRSGIALFLMTGSRARSSVERKFFSDTPVCSNRRGTPGAVAAACAARAAVHQDWEPSSLADEIASHVRFQ